MKPEDLIPTIQGCFSHNLESVVLYGSAVSGNYQDKISNYNLLILTQKTLETNPLTGQKVIKKWLKQNPPPLIWDIEFFKSSIDVFPLEFLELQESHKILLGKPLPLFTVHLHNLRHQLETELRAKYLQLKNHPACLSGDSKILIGFIMKSLPSILTLMKGILYLLKRKPEQNWQKRIEQLALLTDIHSDVFLNLIEVREGHHAYPRKEEVPSILEAYLTELKTMIRFVDKLEDL
ncbi:MAG: hypothetical protein A2W61_02855 [Deltaproteobacteria bacterium RIFCSPLOWO2_01_44_7]|nr:MAG: hypothetical protein A2712_09550 [Deltaproteobacteria bacterium RIFCSPHIGHO2_01_FULL_43_49]OGQ14937.1 MAG: hypothetical protein A3D22_00135 [Deltaproteobacteria bacterium RIFCSPHIGHO2_02_FULL_44_53]OGQ29560.1 MAG: hypothetical protein A3D98_10280 [Deltaproteobacteria bacterium RIFCSPHIGHO2_12_FULL_44_21]OGQ31049.1 MAG: hypothetical protein A2979_06425 [Deltaproteobacteria bacterium RIFCSPLOWO2_01_FULL_45_74]OGQ39819.1 MAG: hypothetical protein A2W61_02855 [Deltaproteobacteria bacterium 